MNHLRQTSYALILTLVLCTYQIDAAPLVGVAVEENGVLETRAWKKKKGPQLTKTGKIAFGTCFGGLAAIFIGIFVGSKIKREYKAWKAREAERQRFKFDTHGRPVSESAGTTTREDSPNTLPELLPKYEEIPLVTEPPVAANSGREAWTEGTTAVALMPEPSVQQRSEAYVKDDEPPDHDQKGPSKVL